MTRAFTFKDENGDTYTVPESDLAEFQKAVPNAVRTSSFVDGAGKKYAVPEGDEADFFKAVPDAKPANKVKMSDGASYTVPVDEAGDFLKAYRADPAFKKDREEIRAKAEKAAGPKKSMFWESVKGVGRGVVETPAWWRDTVKEMPAAFRYGVNQGHAMALDGDAALGMVSPDKADALNKAYKEQGPSPDDDVARGWFKQAATMVGQQVPTMQMAGGTAGAVGLTTLATGIGAPAAIPMTVGAGSVAMSYGFLRQGIGEIYREARDQGLPHETARMVAIAGGIPFAALERFQVGKVAEGFVTSSVRGSVAKRVASQLAAAGIRTLEEAAAEGGQEMVKLLSTSAGKMIEGDLRASGMSEEALKIARAGVDEFVNTIGPMAVMQLPGFMAGSSRSMADKVFVDQARAWASANPEAAAALAEKEAPSRKDFDAAGLPRASAQDRAATAEVLRGLDLSMPDPTAVQEAPADVEAAPAPLTVDGKEMAPDETITAGQHVIDGKTVLTLADTKVEDVQEMMQQEAPAEPQGEVAAEPSPVVAPEAAPKKKIGRKGVKKALPAEQAVVSPDVGARKGTPEGLARVEAAREQLRAVVNSTDIVGKQRADMIENGKNLVAFLEANADTRKPISEGVEYGDRVAYDGDDAPEGMRSFIYLEGAKAGQRGVASTPERMQENAARKQKEFADEQAEFAKLRETPVASKAEAEAPAAPTPAPAAESPATPAAEGKAAELMTPQEFAQEKPEGRQETAILDALRENRPVSVRAFDKFQEYGLYQEFGNTLPPGYVREGDRYVFKSSPTAPTTPPQLDGAAAQAAQEPGEPTVEKNKGLKAEPTAEQAFNGYNGRPFSGVKKGDLIRTMDDDDNRFVEIDKDGKIIVEFRPGRVKPLASRTSVIDVSDPITKESRRTDFKDAEPAAAEQAKPAKNKGLRMDGTTRPEKAKSKGLATLPEKSVKMMDDAIAAKDVETLTTKGMLAARNKAWRAQFEARTGVKLPKTQRDTRAVVEAWAKPAVADTIEEVSSRIYIEPESKRPAVNIGEVNASVSDTLSSNPQVFVWVKGRETIVEGLNGDSETARASLSDTVADAIEREYGKGYSFPQALTAPATDAKASTPAEVAPAQAAVKVETAPDGDKTLSVPSKDKPGLPPKEQKKWLLTEIDKALQDAPEERVAMPPSPEAVQAQQDLERLQKGMADDDVDALMERYGVRRMTLAQRSYTDIEGKEQKGPPSVEIPAGDRLKRLRDNVNWALRTQWEMVEFEVPGDGTFKVINNKQDLENFKKRAKSLFPAAVPSNALPTPRSTAVPSIAKVGKPQTWKGTEPEAVKLLEPFASKDETRKPIMKPHYDAETGEVIASDGRRLAVLIATKGDGKGKDEGWGRKMKGDMVFPNHTQPIPGYSDGVTPKPDPDTLVLKGVETEPLIRKLRQGALMIGEREADAITLIVRANGQIDVAKNAGEVGQYASGEGAGVMLGYYNPDYVIEAIEFLRRTGSDKITVHSRSPNAPMVLIGNNAYVVQMPVTLTDQQGLDVESKAAFAALKAGKAPRAEIDEGAPLPAGVGAARAANPQEFFGDAVGVKHAYTEARRAQLGLPQRTARESVQDEALAAEVAKMYADNPSIGKYLVSTFAANPDRVPSDIHSAIFAREIVDAETALNNAKDDAGVESANDYLDALYSVVERAGSEAGAALRARRFMMDADYNIGRMTWKLKKDQGGKALSKDQTAEIARIKAEYDAKMQTLDGEVSRLRAEQVKSEEVVKNAYAEVKFAEAAAALLAEPGRKASPVRQRMLSWGDRQIAEALEMLKKLKGQASVGVDPRYLVVMAKYGSGLLAKGVVRFADFTSKMRSVFTDATEADLAKALEMAQAAAEAEKAKAADESRAETREKRKSAPAGKKGDLTKEIKALFRDEIDAGVDTLETALANVHAIVIETNPEMTPEQVRDEFSGYGRKFEMNRTETDKIIAQLRRQAQLEASIEDVAAGTAPKKSGPQREKPSQRNRELERLLRIRMKEAGIITRDRATQRASAIDAIKTRLLNSIADLEKAIATNTRIVADKGIGVEYDAKAQTLKAQRDSLRERYNELFPREAITDEQRLKIALKQAERLADSWAQREKDARSGKFTGSASPTSQPWSSALSDLRMKAEASKAEVARLREIAFPKRTAEQIARDNTRKRYERGIKDLRQRIKNNDFAPRTKPPPVDISKDPEAMKAAVEFALVKLDYAQLREKARLAARGWKQKRLDEAVALMDAQRNVLASYDVSAVGRQGWYLALSHPLLGLKATAAMSLAMTQGRSAQIAQSLRDRANWALYKKYDLVVDDDGTGNFSHVEDRFKLNLVEGIPGIQLSNRAYATFLNVLRADVFDQMLANSRDPSDVSEEKVKALALGINTLSGKGELRFFGRKVDAQTAAHFFWAPRFFMSSLDMLTFRPLRTGTAETRVAFAKTYARAAASTALLYTLVGLFRGDDDDPIEWDPRASDFGAIPFGNHKVGLLGFVRPLLTFAARVITGQSKSGGEVRNLRSSMLPLATDAQKIAGVPFGSGMGNTVGRFLQSKAHPTWGVLLSAITGKDFGGGDITAAGVVQDMVMPLALRESLQSLAIDDPDAAAVATILTMFGVSVGPDYQSPEFNRYGAGEQAVSDIVMDKIKGRKREEPGFTARREKLFAEKAGEALEAATDPSATDGEKATAVKFVGYMGTDNAREALRASQKKPGVVLQAWEGKNKTAFGERLGRFSEIARMAEEGERPATGPEVKSQREIGSALWKAANKPDDEGMREIAVRMLSEMDVDEARAAFAAHAKRMGKKSGWQKEELEKMIKDAKR